MKAHWMVLDTIVLVPEGGAKLFESDTAVLQVRIVRKLRNYVPLKVPNSIPTHSLVAAIFVYIYFRAKIAWSVIT